MLLDNPFTKCLLSVPDDLLDDYEESRYIVSRFGIWEINEEGDWDIVEDESSLDGQCYLLEADTEVDSTSLMIERLTPGNLIIKAIE